MTNLADLAAPISDENPCGEDMSLSAEFDQVVEARRADDPSLDQGDWVTELKVADWHRVADLCTQLLTERTKDIRVCVWLTEAWAHTEGFSGIADAYGIFAQLCATDWPSLHPQPDDDGDEEARINNVARLLHVTVPLMKQQPLTDSSAGRFTLANLESARRAATQTRSDDFEDDGDGASALTQFETARRDTPGSFYAELLNEVDGCRDAFRQLDETLDAQLGVDAPSFARLHDTIRELHELIAGYAEDAGIDMAGDHSDSGTASSDDEPPAQAEETPVPTMAAEAPSSQPSPSASGPIRSRAQAIKQLRQVAEYFRRAEPHSPVAYMAETAARWGDMPLHSWLRSVIRDDGELAHVEELLGLSNQARSGGESAGNSADDFDGDMYQ